MGESKNTKLTICVYLRLCKKYKNMYKILYFICLFIPFSSIAQSGSHAFNISQCVKYALDNQYSIKNAHFDEYIAQQQVNNITGAGLPQVNASVNLQGNIQVPQFFLPFGPNGSFVKLKAGQPFQHNANVNVGQLVFDGTFFLGLEAAREFVNLSKIMTERTEIEVINNVVTAYYTALTAREGGALIDLNLQRLEKMYKDTDAMYRNGLVEKIDLDRIQISINNLKTEQQKFERMVALTVELLKFQMAMPIEDKLILTEKLPEINVENTNIDNLGKIDFSKRIESKLLDQQALLEDYNRRRYVVSYYPSIYAFGYYQFNMQGEKVFNFEETGTFSQSAAGLKINIPIFDGLRTNAKIQESKINSEKIKISRQILERGLQMEMENSLATLKNSRDNYKIQTENVELAKSVFAKTQLKYKEGVGSSLEVNNAEIAIKEAERNRLTAQLEYLTAELKVQVIKGELREKYGR